MEQKTEVAFYWDWKAQPDICKIVETVQKIEKETGKKVNCYKVNTKTDSHAIVVTINEYTSEEELRKKCDKLFCEQEGCKYEEE